MPEYLPKQAPRIRQQSGERRAPPIRELQKPEHLKKGEFGAVQRGSVSVLYRGLGNGRSEIVGAGGGVAPPAPPGTGTCQTARDALALAQAHHPRHENDGLDEINVAGLSGALADDQPPQAHVLDGAKHTISGKTARQVLTALTATTFGFAAGHAMSGLDAAKGSPAADGDLYYATDTNKLYVGDGGAWVEVGGGGGTTDHAALTHLDFPSAGHTGNLGITKADPEVRLTDTGDSEYTRVTRADTDAKAARYNQVYKPGAAGYAIDLDGAQDYITLGTDAAFDLTGDHSIEMWVKTSSPARRGLFHRFVNSGGYPGYDFELVGYGGAAGQLSYININVGWKFGTSVGVVNDGQWHHVAIVVDADVGGTFYKDGAADGGWSDTTSGPPSAGATAAEIGRNYIPDYLLGQLDEVRVYSKALTPTEITAHYNAGAGQYGAPEANLVAGWHLDEGSGVTVADYSGNAHTGTLKPTGTEPGFVAGKFNVPGAEVEVAVWQSQDGVEADEKGIQTIGDADGRTVLAGKLDIQQRLTPANPSSGWRRLFVDSGDGKLKVRTSGGASISLEEGGAALRIIDNKSLLPDGAFEIDVDGNGIPDWWNWPAVTGGTRTLITTDSVAGRQCVQFSRTSNSALIDMWALTRNGVFDDRHIPIDRAKTYSLAIWTRSWGTPADNRIQVWVYQANRAGAYLTATLVIDASPASDTWAESTGSIGPASWNANAVYAYILVRDASANKDAINRVDGVRFWLP